MRRSRGAEEAAGQAALAFLNQASSVGQVAARADYIARGSLAGPRASVRRSCQVFLTSVTARIRGLYDAMPEASQAMPVVSFTLADLPSLFSSSTLLQVLNFSLTAGGGGLSRLDRLSFAGLLRRVEGGAGVDSDGDFSSTFLTNHSVVTGIRREQNRVVAMLQWKEVPLDIREKIYQFFHRALLDVGVAAVTGATNVDLDGGALPSTLDGQRRTSGTLDADMFLQEAANILRLHGDSARMLSVSLHADEALVSLSGAHYMIPIRAHFPSAVGSGSVTAGCILHISKAFIHTAAAHLAVSDARNDLVQRCLAVFMRRSIRASEFGFPVELPGIGRVLLVPRLGGLVVYQPQERSFYALMAHRCVQFCTRCTVRRSVACEAEAEHAPERAVIATLEAQLAAAEVRMEDPRPSRRIPLAQAHSALPFAPVLGAMHGLSTGDLMYFRVGSLDVLHLWKLGILRALAQNVLDCIRSVCTSAAGAVMGPATATLDVLNLRGFELGRLSRTSPAALGYVLARTFSQTSFIAQD